MLPGMTRLAYRSNNARVTYALRADDTSVRGYHRLSIGVAADNTCIVQSCLRTNRKLELARETAQQALRARMCALRLLRRAPAMRTRHTGDSG